MGAGHGHGGSGTVGTGHAGTRHRWRLALAFALVGAFFVDVVALGAALAATRIATRTDTTGRRTYGSYRAEVFASGFTVLLMLGAAAYVTVEAVRRLGADVEPQTGPMLVVGGLGLVVNLIALVLLRGGASESLAIKGAYFEVIADSLGSVGVMAAAVLVLTTGRGWWDTVVALAIALFVAVRAVMLGREVLAVLGQHAPAGVDPDAVAADLESMPGVVDVHDLHLWTLTSGMHVATAHLVADPADREDVLAGAQTLLRERHGIDHATVQVETEARSCDELSW